MSKYFDVVSADGNEAEYQGAMAKRIMPPPASSYVTVNPVDSLKIAVNLNKAYRFSEVGKYVIKYNSANISGIVVKDSVILNLVK
ncbi:23S rRNA maturation-related 3'-5' exoribonuclease YhaM [Pedobacter sp. UYEF25]